MKALFDNNVVIDVLQGRPEFIDDSYESLRLVAQGKVEGHIAASSLVDVWYILKKSLGADGSRMAIVNLTAALHVCDTRAASVAEALTSPMTDFADAVLAACARRIGADVIVTRDLHDFSASPVPAVTPAALVESMTVSDEDA
jgi:predicted nucleic acid-binding protein